MHCVPAVDEDEAAALKRPADKEIQHLMRSMRNVRESIHLSAAANVNPSAWQQNVLKMKHYGQDELDQTVYRAPALAVFELMQMSL